LSNIGESLLLRKDNDNAKNKNLLSTLAQQPRQELSRRKAARKIKKKLK
jgi:hypothetical protein